MQRLFGEANLLAHHRNEGEQAANVDSTELRPERPRRTRPRSSAGGGLIFIGIVSTALLAPNLPAAIPGHGLGWGTCEMAPGVILTNITSSSSSYHNLAIRNDGTVFEFGNLDGPPTPPTNVIAVAAGGGAYQDYPISSQYHS